MFILVPPLMHLPIATLCWLLVCLLCTIDQSFAHSDSCDATHGMCYPPKDIIIDKIKNSEKDELLPWQSGQPLRAFFGFYIESLSNFRSTDMSFDMDMYARLSWQDTRLRHNFSTPFLLTDLDDINLLWKPDLYFANAKQASFQTVTEPNRSLRIFKDGSVHYSARVTLTLSCNQDLRKYPMDTQRCHIRTLSWSHIRTKLEVSWFNDPIQLNRNIELPEMDIRGVEPGYCNGTYRYGETEHYFLVGNFSCLQATIYLRRDIGYHVVQTYIPTGLIVIISWVSFWIDPGAIPARISLSFTTLLTLSTMAAGVRVSLPPVSYAKAIDMWMGMCMAFVFLGLLEFAVVNSMLRYVKKLEDTGRYGQHNRVGTVVPNHHTDDTDELKTKLLRPKLVQSLRTGSFVHKAKSDEYQKYREMPAEQRERLQMLYTQRARCIDKICAFAMPGAFALFNVAYWWYFLSGY